MMMCNYICINHKCNYYTGSPASNKIKDLNELVKADGGFIEKDRTQCPTCKKDTLVYESLG